MMDFLYLFLSFLFTPLAYCSLFHCDLSTQNHNKRTKKLLMKLTCSGHSLLQEAASRTLFHVYSSVDMRMARSVSEVAGRIQLFLYHLQEIIYAVCQLKIFEYSFLLPLKTIVPCKATSRQLSIRL